MVISVVDEETYLSTYGPISPILPVAHRAKWRLCERDRNWPRLRNHSEPLRMLNKRASTRAISNPA